MSQSPRREDRLDHSLAFLLKLGTWVACACTGLGLFLPQVSIGGGVHFNPMVAGVVLLIALPAARVALMAVWFALHRERQFALVAFVVLCIIVVSAILGAAIAPDGGSGTRSDTVLHSGPMMRAAPDERT